MNVMTKDDPVKKKKISEVRKEHFLSKATVECYFSFLIKVIHSSLKI